MIYKCSMWKCEDIVVSTTKRQDYAHYDKEGTLKIQKYLAIDFVLINESVISKIFFLSSEDTKKS